MEKEMENCHRVTGVYRAGQGAEWVIKGHRNGVVMAIWSLHEAEPGSQLEERR